MLGGDFNPAAVGVDCRSGEGDAGDSGRRNGELRWEPWDPYPRGEGLYPAGADWRLSVKLS